MSERRPIAERIARAMNPGLWAHDVDSVNRSDSWKVSVRRDRGESLEAARRVLEALREPDEKMVQAGEDFLSGELRMAMIEDHLAVESRSAVGEYFERVSIAVLYRTMIDAALRS